MAAYPLALLFVGLIAGQVIALPVVAGARITLLDVAVVAVLLAAALISGRKRFIPRLWMPILGFAAVLLLSLFATVGSVPRYVVGGGLLYILRWVTYAALYWVAASNLYPSVIWQKALVWSGIVLAALGLLQYAWYPDLRNLYYLGWDPHYQRLFSTLLDPNFTGIMLGLTALTLLGMKLSNPTRISGLVVLIGALLLTYSRSSIIAFVVGLGAWGMLTKKTALVGIVLLLLLGCVIILPRTGEGRNLLRTASAYARLGSADRAITLIREKPILGHGFNILRFVARERSWIDDTVIPSRAGAGLDTSLLFVGATTGVTGMIAYGWLLVALFGAGWLGLRSKKTAYAASSYIAMLTALLVHSLFINSLFYPWVMAWLWIMTGTLEQSIRADR